MKTSKAAFLVACMFVAGFAGAQSKTVDDRKAVIDAQIDLVKKQKDLQDALRALAGTSASGMPVVVSVTIGNERIARLQLPNGTVGHYREGESVRPGIVVSSIAPKQVFVAISQGKKATAIPLEFAGPVLAGPAAAGSQQQVPDALLPAAPVVDEVPAIQVIPDAKPAAKSPPASAAPAVSKTGK